ncbi:Piso0_001562 [Millerozyma farinosa CBS 7064]|uniref:Piso0_001562 protein n=1 Tax=Pichia sorbitophila (strain ATCC MYA-4447 / BCRC 22081 / CBS 7064 / NBRC 10061 / NRRL Y-12695) TaxID=559304 RepID=G8YL46_PICSO|nr:Piso0_001562 [Millerozyma farinosa CBS 7064]
MRGPERVHTRQSTSEGRRSSVHGMLAGARRAAGGYLASKQGTASQTKNGSGRSGEGQPVPGCVASLRSAAILAGVLAGDPRKRPRPAAKAFCGVDCHSVEMSLACCAPWCGANSWCGANPVGEGGHYDRNLAGRAGEGSGGRCSLFGVVVGPGPNRYTRRNGSDSPSERRKRPAPPSQAAVQVDPSHSLFALMG